MKIDFLDEECCQKTSSAIFGICDGLDNMPAYITIDAKLKWVAVVRNESQMELSFHAVDDCIQVLRPDGSKGSRCDAMLTYPNNIVFVELKEEQSQWISRGIGQLRATILLFGKNHDLLAYRKRRAFLANRKHPSFQYGHAEEMEKFRSETTVRLIIHNQIKI